MVVPWAWPNYYGHSKMLKKYDQLRDYERIKEAKEETLAQINSYICQICIRSNCDKLLATREGGSKESNCVT